jgi:hypothetical protein
MGVYSWHDACASDAASGGPAYHNDFYSRVSSGAHSDWPIMGSACKGFYDKLASWKGTCPNGKERFIPQDNAQTWMDMWKYMAPWFNAGSDRMLDYLVVHTWNDYEEGTELETGITAGFAVTASITGAALSWNIAGNLNALHHVRTWVSTDNINLSRVDLKMHPTSRAGAFDLSSLGLAPGSYHVYVSAIGVNSVQNATSADLTYTVQSQVVVEPPPVVIVPPEPPPDLPPPPPPPPELPAGDPLNPIEVITESPVTPPDPHRFLCERFRTRHIASGYDPRSKG